MDHRMRPLAAYLRELRKDWPAHAIQAALTDLGHLPYDRVAVAAVRTAVDPAAAHPRAIRAAAEAERGRGTPVPAALCRECRRPHNPDRPGEHVLPLTPDAVERGAALARDALRAARLEQAGR